MLLYVVRPCEGLRVEDELVVGPSGGPEGCCEWGLVEDLCELRSESQFQCDLAFASPCGGVSAGLNKNRDPDQGISLNVGQWQELHVFLMRRCLEPGRLILCVGWISGRSNRLCLIRRN